MRLVWSQFCLLRFALFHQFSLLMGKVLSMPCSLPFFSLLVADEISPGLFFFIQGHVNSDNMQILVIQIVYSHLLVTGWGVQLHVALITLLNPTQVAEQWLPFIQQGEHQGTYQISYSFPYSFHTFLKIMIATQANQPTSYKQDKRNN